MVSPFWRTRKLWMVMVRMPALRVLEARLSQSRLASRWACVQSAKISNGDSSGLLGFDDALQGRGAEGPVAWVRSSSNDPAA